MVVLRSHKTQSFDWDSARTAKFYDSVYFVKHSILPLPESWGWDRETAVVTQYLQQVFCR